MAAQPVSGAWRGVHPRVVAALSLALIATGATLTYRALTTSREPVRVVRSRGGTLSAVATIEPDGGVRIRWPAVPGAAVYHVRLAGSKGPELTKDSSAPSVSITGPEAATLGDLDVKVDAESATGAHTSVGTTIALSRRR